MRVRLLASGSLFSIVAVASALTLGGCGSSTQKPRGTLGAACYADNLCNAELTCLAGVCVPADGGSLPIDAASGDTHADTATDSASDAVPTTDAGANDGGDAAPASDGGDAAPASDAGDAAPTNDGGDAAPADANASDGGGEDGSAADGGADAQDDTSSDAGATG